MPILSKYVIVKKENDVTKFYSRKNGFVTLEELYMSDLYSNMSEPNEVIMNRKLNDARRSEVDR